MEKKRKSTSTKVLLDHIEKADKRKRNYLIFFVFLFFTLAGTSFYALGPTYLQYLFEESSHKSNYTQNTIPENTALNPSIAQNKKVVQSEQAKSSLNISEKEGAGRSMQVTEPKVEKAQIFRDLISHEKSSSSPTTESSSQPVAKVATIESQPEAITPSISPRAESSNTDKIEKEGNTIEQEAKHQVVSRRAISETNASIDKSLSQDEVKVEVPEVEAKNLSPRISAEKMPSFPGGNKAMFTFLNNRIEYPRQAQDFEVEGKVYVQFIVNTLGQIQDPKVVKGLGYGCDQEALRIVSLMPKWEAGIENGKTVPVIYTLPISFQFQ